MTEQRGDSIKWKYQIIIAQQKCGTHRIKMFLNLLKKTNGNCAPRQGRVV